MRWLLLSLLSLLLHGHTAFAAPQSLEGKLKTGDLVFHTSRSRQSAAIQAATGSPLSHVGLVEVTPRGVFVVEAVQPVQRVRFAKWKARGVRGRLLVLRPEGVTEARKAAALREAKRHLGKPYDWRFGWGDEALYCSELVHKAYAAGAGEAYGKLERLGTLDVKRLGPELRERYGGKVPLDLELLTPASLAADERLTVVHSDFPALR
jgi:Permuted papain-like amidase enzyme, YaeF/YiiX, C92 family